MARLRGEHRLPIDRTLTETERSSSGARAVLVGTLPELLAPAIEQALRVLLQQSREHRIGNWRRPGVIEVLRKAVRLARVEAGEVEVAKRGTIDHWPAVEFAQLSFVQVPRMRR